KRLMSNLINNSFEALQSDGIVEVEAVEGIGSEAGLSDSSQWLTIKIRDNGIGIPPHILSRLGRHFVTYGKEGTSSGSGIGVYSAQRWLESWGGNLKIESKFGAGATVTLQLKKQCVSNDFDGKGRFKKPFLVVPSQEQRF